MKKIVLLIAFATILSSCNSIRVSSDFNEEINFTEFKTYAFSKSGIDKVEINDIDKKRILKAIDVELYNKGFRKSSIEPDFIVNFFTETNKKVNFYPSSNYYGSMVQSPYGSMGHYTNSWYLNSFDFIDYKIIGLSTYQELIQIMKYDSKPFYKFKDENIFSKEIDLINKNLWGL